MQNCTWILQTAPNPKDVMRRPGGRRRRVYSPTSVNHSPTAQLDAIAIGLSVLAPRRHL
jgi:hypothetical protein